MTTVVAAALAALRCQLMGSNEKPPLPGACQLSAAANMGSAAVIEFPIVYEISKRFDSKLLSCLK